MRRFCRKISLVKRLQVEHGLAVSEFCYQPHEWDEAQWRARRDLFAEDEKLQGWRYGLLG